MPERIAAIDLRRLPVEELKPHPRNPRTHPKPDSPLWVVMRKSLEHDYFDPIVWNERNSYLVSGHLRLKVLAELGFTHVDVSVRSYDEPTHYARMIAANRPLSEFEEATLGLSAANADTLASLTARGLIGGITLVCSHYFAQVDKTTTYRDIVARLEGIAKIITTRSHAKIICLPTDAGDHYVLEGSANLRSSDNTEQLVIFNDPALLAWHTAWIATLT